jgi:hypothetical protein
MADQQQQQPSANAPTGAVVSWRAERLTAVGFPAALARSIAADGAYDLHALLSLVDRGCPAVLATRILAPLHERVRGD